MSDGGPGAAERTIRILFDLEFAERSVERAVVHEPTQRGLAEAGEELDRFHRLETSNDTREHAQDTSFSSCRDRACGRGLGEEAAITGAAEMGGENGELPFELKNGAVDEGLFEEEGSVVGSEAGGKVVGSVEEEIVGFEECEGISRFEFAWMENDFDVGIDPAEAGFGAFEFGMPDE